MIDHTIPAGYQLHIDTWENDADARVTKIWSGLSKEDCAFLIALCERFRSRNAHDHTKRNGFKGLGNGSTTAEDLLGAFFSTLNEHQHISRDMRQLFEDVIPAEEDDNDAAEILYDILCDQVLGYPVNETYSYDYENFCRVFDDYKVYYFEQPVNDVTHEFQ